MIRAPRALQPYQSGRVPPEQRAVADVAPGHGDRAVPAAGSCRYGVTASSSFARCAPVKPPTRRFSSTPLAVISADTFAAP